MNFSWGRGMSNCSIFGFEMVNDLVGISYWQLVCLAMTVKDCNA